jgi:hypothetical protein
MDRQRFVFTACVFVAALAASSGAVAHEPRGVSREHQTVVGDDGGGSIEVASNARLDAVQATPAETQADAQVQEAKPARKPKAQRKVCIHGEWVNPGEFNPFSPACTYVGY